MMKKIILSAFLSLIAVTGLQAQKCLSQYKVSEVIPVRLPLQSDSINFIGERFDLNELLQQTPVDLNSNDKEGLKILKADTTGYVQIEKSDIAHEFYVFSTRLRAEHFLKGNLKVYSPLRMEIFLDGESVALKTTTQDSLSQIEPTWVPLRMEPEHDCELTIKMLAAPSDKHAPALKCEVEKEPAFTEIQLAESPVMKKRLALYNTAFGDRVRNVSFSPDGKYLMMTISYNYSPERSRSITELRSTKNNKVISNQVPEGAQWMPLGSRLYYTVKGEYSRDLVVLNPETHQEKIVKQDIPDGYFAWSPNEDYLLYTMYDEGEKVDGPLKRHFMPDDRIPGARGRAYLAKYNLKSGLLERLTYGTQSVYLNDFSADGKKLLCSTVRTNITKCPFNLNSVFEIDLSTLKADTLVKDDAYVNSASYSPDGKKILLIGSPSAFQGLGKNCGDLPIANDFDTQAYIMDLMTRKVEPITLNFNPSVELILWNRTDQQIYFLATDKDCKPVYSYNPNDGKFTKLPFEEDVISSFSVAEDAPQMMAYVGGGDYSTGVAYLYQPKKHTSVLLANPMQAILADIELGVIKDWNFTAKNGTIIKGQICLPPHFDETKKYPLIVYYYGGTLPSTRGIASTFSPQLFASRDYVVYVLQPSGTIGFGQEFSARHVNAWGDWTADEIIEGTKKFCEAHPFVNSERIGCIGASYGGFMTQYLQTKTDLFAAAVSHAGISNVTSYWGEGYWGYSYNAVAAAESYPWSRPELFTKHGSLFNADKINTPLLLMHGTADTNVPIGESIQLYNALKILGKTVEFITVDGENHSIADYPKRELWHNTIMAWFARWLQDEPGWWNDLYPERHW